MACSVFASFWQRHWYVILITKKKKNRLEVHRDRQKILSTEFSGYPKARQFSGQRLWMQTVPTPKEVHV